MKYSSANQIAFHNYVKRLEAELAHAKADGVKAIIMKQIADAKRSYNQFKSQQAQNNMDQLLGTQECVSDTEQCSLPETFSEVVEPAVEECIPCEKKRGRKKKE